MWTYISYSARDMCKVTSVILHGVISPEITRAILTTGGRCGAAVLLDCEMIHVYIV